MNDQQWMDTLDPIDVEKHERLTEHLCLTIVYHPNTERIGERTYILKDQSATRSALSRLTPLFFKEDGTKSGPLASLCLSRRPLWLSPVPPSGVMLANEQPGSETIANGVPLTSHREFSPQQLKAGVVLELARRVVLLLHSVRQHEASSSSLGFIGHSEAIEQVRSEVRKIANHDTPVLIRGETGVGKELAARAIHASSQRSQHPFLCVNMAAISSSLAVSELFGHVEGAFTGAVGKHRGYFQQAHRGTLFLDEIGASPMQIQAMLLRALESNQIQPVGDCNTQPVDVRVIAATDENLEHAIEDGRFRVPLYHRLSSYLITIPPLRERRDDIGRLLISFLRKELDAIGEIHRLGPVEEGTKPWVPTSQVGKLVRHTWPGNVRELHNLVRQIVISSREADTVFVDPAFFKPDTSQKTKTQEAKPTTGGHPTKRNPSEIEEQELIVALRSNNWHIGATASQLKISRTSIYVLIERSERIRKAKDIKREELITCLGKYGNNLSMVAKRLEVSQRGLKLRMKELGLL